jgi:SAM-dependent methyltransferase
LCEGCGSLERHRALATRFAGELTDGHGRSALDVAPYSRLIFGDHLAGSGWTVTRIDKWRTGNPRDSRNVSFVDAEVDLVDMGRFDDGRFGLVIVQHVIEEIEDYEQALAEIARVLGARGVALLEIPWRPARARSERQAPDRFGNVWTFGSDLRGSLESAFARVEAVELREGAYAGTVFACRTG